MKVNIKFTSPDSLIPWPERQVVLSFSNAGHDHFLSFSFLETLSQEFQINSERVLTSWGLSDESIVTTLWGILNNISKL